MKPTRKLKSTLISILCLALSLTHFYGCQAPINNSSSSAEQKNYSSVESNEGSRFDDYTRELFIQEVTSNTINLHYTLKDPEAYGIKDYEISLGNLSHENIENSVSQLENMKSVLDSFDFDALNDRQRLTLTILKDFCDGELGISDLTYYSEPLRPTTGVTSELPVLLAEYSFSSQKDVTDYLTLLGFIQDYFNSILDFEKQKSKEGLFMSDTAVNTILESCRSFTIDPENNYLISTFNTRIDEMQDVPKEKKETYKAQNRNLVLQKVIPSYQNMIDELSKLKGTGKNEKGLCHLPRGKDYYAYLVKSYTGSDRSVEELQKLTETQRNSDIINVQQIAAKNPSLILSSQGADITVESPESALNFLQEKMLSDFPAATNTSFEINYVHESLEDALAPAFYLTAPLDDLNHNVIYINKKSDYQGVQLFTTLAHEGYPGHLYQTTGSQAAGLEPVRSLLNYPGFVEGWATYVEMISYKYMDLKAEISNILMYNQSALLSLYATVDMGIHNDGWSLDDVKKFFEDYGIKDEETIQSIYDLIVQEPAHYLKYYIGYLEFLELKKDMKDAWGSKYTDLEFHKKIVEAGPMPFYILREYLLEN